MLLDLPRAASRISFANPAPANVQTYDDPSPQCLIGAMDDFDLHPAGALLLIEQLGCMPENWDGYGALPLASETTHNAKAALRFIQASSPTPDIVPNPNGTISFEWESEKGFATLEIGKTKISFFLKIHADHAPILLQAGSLELRIACQWINQVVSNYLYPEQTHSFSLTQFGLYGHGRDPARYR